MSSTTDFSPAGIASRIKELRGQIAEKRRELDQLTEEMEWWEQGRRFFGGGSESASGDPGRGSAADVKPSLRQAILKVMGERPTRTWAAERVIAELENRGWLPNGKNAAHTTRSMLADMTKRKQLKRTGRGRYRLPPEEEDA